MTVTVEQARSGGIQRALMLAAVVGAATVYEHNSTNATVVLPQMLGSFSATHDQISWVITAFFVGMIVGFTWSGWCSDRFGRKQFFVFCVAGYTVASWFCGAATGLEEEVAWRFIQGAIGAPMMPLSQAIVLDSFPRRQHGTANAIWGVGIMLGPMSGPVVGGYIAEFYEWPWVFYINLPIGIVALVACWTLIPNSERNPARNFDWLGFITLILAVGALQLLLNRGERLDWFESLEVILEAAVAVLCLYLFIVHCLTARRPFIDLTIFRDRNVAIGLFLTLVWGFMLHGVLVLLSLLMQELRGYPVMTLGTVLLPRGVGVMIGMLAASRLVKHFDPRHIMIMSLGCLAVSAWVMSRWSLDVTAWDVAWTGALQGFSTGCGFIPLMVKAFSTIDKRSRSDGLTFFHIMVFTGIAAGIAFAVNIVTRSTTVLHATLVEHVTPFNELFRYFTMPEAWDPESLAGLAALDIEIMRQAAMIGYLNYFYLLAIMAVITIPVVFLFGGGKVTAETLSHED